MVIMARNGMAGQDHGRGPTGEVRPGAGLGSNRRDGHRRTDVAVVDDEQSVHRLARDMFAADGKGFALQTYTSGEQALERIPSELPAVVLMDIGMPGMSGIECTRHLIARLPDLRVVMFTGRSDKDSILQSIMAGACGFITKPSSTGHLIRAVIDAGNDLLALCPAAQRVVGEFLHGIGRAFGPGALSQREHEVMLCLARGMKHKDIAKGLGVSSATVHAHLATIYKKLDAHDRSEARRIFLRLYGGGRRKEEKLKLQTANPKSPRVFAALRLCVESRRSRDRKS